LRRFKLKTGIVVIAGKFYTTRKLLRKKFYTDKKGNKRFKWVLATDSRGKPLINIIEGIRR